MTPCLDHRGRPTKDPVEFILEFHGPITLPSRLRTCPIEYSTSKHFQLSQFFHRVIRIFEGSMRYRIFVSVNVSVLIKTESLRDIIRIADIPSFGFGVGPAKTPQLAVTFGDDVAH